MCESHKPGHENVLFRNACNFENYPTSKIIIAGGPNFINYLGIKIAFTVKFSINSSITYVMILVFVL